MSYEILDKQRVFDKLFNRQKSFLTLKDLPNPYLFKGMKESVLRVVKAIKRGEKIALIGDYDVDGVVATTIVRKAFSAFNYPLEWVIPNRFSDGYGISKKIVDRLDANLIITVDNGIAAIEAANACKSRGIDLIITDHHSLPPTLPEAYSIINQKQSDCRFEYKEICGAQIAWYFMVAIAKELNIKIDSKELLSLASLAIVADIMPLNGINRVMLIAGLQHLQKKQSAFLKALEKKDMLKGLNSEKIAYYLAPLINSAGRLKDASIASEFLFTNSESRALEILEELIILNNERKSIEKEIFSQAKKQVSKSDNIAICYGEGWNEGVVGIVASKIAEHFKIPAIVLSLNGEICKGSGRNYGNGDLFGLVSEVRDELLKFGGHKAAIGLSFKQEKLPIIKQILNIKALDYNDNNYVDKSILGILPFEYIDFELLDILEKFEPYGEANPKPKFIAKDVEILEVYEVGVTKEHKRYRLKSNNKILTAIEFRSKSSVSKFDRVDIKFTLSKNFYNDNVYINLYIEEFL